MTASAAWQDVQAMLECRLSNNSHFCANCGNRLDDIWPAIERVRAADAQQIAALREMTERLGAQRDNFLALVTEMEAEKAALKNAANLLARGELSSGKFAELVECDDKHGFKTHTGAFDDDTLLQQIAALRAENEKLFKELAYEVDQRRQVENLMQLEVSVAAVRCLGNKHHWSESADAEGDTCDCGEWYRFADRIESSR